MRGFFAKCLRFLLLASVLLSACLAPKQEIPVYSRLIAEVGDYQIKEDLLRFRFRLELDKFPKEYVQENRKKPLDETNPLKPILNDVLSRMIEDDIILTYGRMKGVAISDAELAARFEKKKTSLSAKDLENTLASAKIPFHRWKTLIEEQIRVQYVMEKLLSQKLMVTLSEIQSYYNHNKDEFKTKERARVRHIVTDSQAKAEEILDRLNKGENFAQLAVNHSISPDRAQGGDLGYFQKGSFPEVFDKAFELERGQISPILKSPYGYHIFKLLDKQPSGHKPLEEVSGLIEQKIFEEKLKKNYKTWLEEIRKQVPVVIHEDNLKSFIL